MSPGENWASYKFTSFSKEKKIKRMGKLKKIIRKHIYEKVMATLV